MQIPEPQGITSTTAVGRVGSQVAQQAVSVQLVGGGEILQSGTTVAGQVANRTAQGALIQTANGQTLQASGGNLAEGQNVAVRFLNSGRQAQAEVFPLANDAQLAARFSVGQQTQGTVLGRLQGGGLLTQIGNLHVEANGPNSLRPGDLLSLKVEQLTPNAQFSIQTGKAKANPNGQVLTLLRSAIQQPAPLHQALGRIATLATALATGTTATAANTTQAGSAQAGQANGNTSQGAPTGTAQAGTTATGQSTNTTSGQQTNASSAQAGAASSGQAAASAGQPLAPATGSASAANAATLNDGTVVGRGGSQTVGEGGTSNANQPAATLPAQEGISAVLVRLEQLLQQLKPQAQGKLAEQFLDRLDQRPQTTAEGAQPQTAQPAQQRTESVIQQIRTLIAEHLPQVESSAHPQAEALAEGMRDVMHQAEIELLLNLLARGSEEPYRFELPILGHQPTTVFLAIDPEASPEDQQSAETPEKRFRILLSLDLPEMGKVRIMLTLTEQQANVGLFVEQPETRGLLEAQLGKLTGRLTELGFGEANLQTRPLGDLSNAERSQFELLQSRYTLAHNTVDTVG